MTRAGAALIALALAACAAPRPSPEELAQQQAATAARVEAQYGPTCQSAGFERGGERYAQCLQGFYQQERGERRARAAAIILQSQQGAAQPPKYTNPLEQMLLRPQTNCTTQVIGGIAYTNCQ